MNKVDLHVHSKFSNDGEFEIQEIFDRCNDNKIETFSITDHNSVKGIIEAISNCLNQGIEFIPGIEIDCSYKGTDLHVLGYNIDWQSDDFIELEKLFQKNVMDSFPEMIENLAKSGIKVDANEVLEKSEGKLPCGELIAEVLLTNTDYHSNKKLTPYLSGGERSDMPYINFYHDYFAQGKPAYVKINYMDYRDTIELIKDNAGIPIIAHPGMNFRGKEELISELLDFGAKGLEVFNNYHDSKQINYFADLVSQGDYIMTCGSDFHGKNKPLIKIGEFKFNAEYKDYLNKSLIKIRHTIIRD